MSLMHDDLRIKALRPLLPPAILMEEFPLPAKFAEFIEQIRRQATAIVQGNDDRLLVIVGPCSIHDPEAALEYAGKLAPYIKKYAKELCIIMRVYFEKPRTTVGWKGLINDPHLDSSYKINDGLRRARKLLLDILQKGVPAGTEFLDTIIPQFIADLISWGAIGARTTESQIHRELASGLSMPVGFKNGTAGNIQVAIDAIEAAVHPHQFLGVTKQGTAAIVSTLGNDACHVILRGSNMGSNYDENTIKETAANLKKAKLAQRIMIDCSHGNSQKDHMRQLDVAKALCEQVSNGANFICGMMLESHLAEGKQVLNPKKPLKYGQSITDACISWEQTLPILAQFADAVKKRRSKP